MTATEKEKMLRGELFLAFEPQLSGERIRARRACQVYNSQPCDAKRRTMVKLWRE
jgi:hypothetical protein